MNIFISSLISGFEEKRNAVKRAISILGHNPIMAEDFGARSDSPQVTCLKGVREADAVILILGARYGAKQQQGLSATHEEVLEARTTKPLIIFLEAGVEPEHDQAELLNEVSAWEKGLFREEFISNEDLFERCIKAISQLQLAHALSPVDPEGLKNRAIQNLPNDNQSYFHSSVRLQISVAVGPDTTIIRPAQMDEKKLVDMISQEALFGNNMGQRTIFDKQSGFNESVEYDSLCISQSQNREMHNLVKLSPSGDVLLILSMPMSSGGLPVILEEKVSQTLSKGFDFIAWLLLEIDSTQRLTHIVPAVFIAGASNAGWRTLAEHQANPNSMQSSFGIGQSKEPVLLSPAHIVRQSFALSSDRKSYVEDFVALLKRMWQVRRN
ncbi:DUF4062 domain-containing protein [Pantoea ananatis]|uniref:DUF4062 domain-containing protein n=1 Tax=Pantoea ananas TaxID=553 RepID=UPI001B303640|nr:DUF4062 domain-containing protein [Pantoea ananatis]